MSTQRFAALACVCAPLVIGWTPPAQAQDTAESLAVVDDAQLLGQAQQRFDAGDLDAAARLLDQIDEVALPEDAREQLQQLRQSLVARATQGADAPPPPPVPEGAMTPAAPAGGADARNDIEVIDLYDLEGSSRATPRTSQPAPRTPRSPAPPRVQRDPMAAPVSNPVTAPAASPRELVAQADRVAQQNPAQALNLYRQAASATDDAQLKAQIEARAAQAQRQVDSDLTWASGELDKAKDDYVAGDYTGAQRRLRAVQARNLNLGYFDQLRLDQQLRVVQTKLGTGDAADVNARPMSPTVDAGRNGAGPDIIDLSLNEADETAGVLVVPERTAPQTSTVAGRGSAVPTAGIAGPGEEVFLKSRQRTMQAELEQADDAEAGGRTDTAIYHLERARTLADDPQARASLERRLDDLRAVSGQGPRMPVGPLEGASDVISAAAEAARVQYNDYMRDARQALGQDAFQRAGDRIEQARQVLDANRKNISVQEFQALYQSTQDLETLVQQRELLVTGPVQEGDSDKINQEGQINRIDVLKQQDQRVQELLYDALTAQRQMKYGLALEYVERALAIDPLNFAAQAMREMIRDSLVLVEGVALNREKRLYGAMNSNVNLEAAIPYTELLRYPPDWPELTVRRLASLQGEDEMSERDRQVEQQLAQEVPVDFEANTLANVVDYFRNITGMNIAVNWQALQATGVTQDTPITLKLRNVPVRKALQLVLEQATLSTLDPITYSVDEGIVRISTQADLQRTTVVRVFDIRDLLVAVPTFSDVPVFDLAQVLGGANQNGGGGGGGGGGGFGGGGGGNNPFGGGGAGAAVDPNEARTQMIEQIRTLVVNSVGEPEPWALNEYTLQELNGNLIVKTTPDLQRQVSTLLESLRETRAIQISVEARFLLVSKSFLEEIGVDLDVQINDVGGNFGPITISQDSINNATAQQSPLGASPFSPRAVGNTSAGSFLPNQGFAPNGRALDIGATFIDDLEVNLLVTATQNDLRSISLTAPRVTFFNGQRAYVNITRQVSFISDLEAVPDAGGGAAVELDVVNSGVLLDVEGVVSADRRYVTLTLRPSLSNIVQIRQIAVNSVNLDPGNNNGNPTDPTDPDAPPVPVAITSNTIEAPELEVTSIRSTVSIPDKGTLLIGGQRLLGEVEVESGVPVLSKIPLLNRLFTNKSITKDERTLLILVKPTILIQSEEEELRFPGLLDNPSAYELGNRVRP